MDSLPIQPDVTRAEQKTASPPYWTVFRRQLQHLLKSYTFRVVMQGLLTLWLVTTFTFFLIRKMPGNPVDIQIDRLMLTYSLTYEEARNQAASLFDFDPEASLMEQYVDYLGNLLQGDMGRSITASRTPVHQQILRFLPWTLFSVGLGLLISFTLGVFIGMAMAYWRGSLFDNVMTAFASVIYGIPDFVIIFIIILLFGVQWNFFKVGDVYGGVDPGLESGFNLPYLKSLIQHGFLVVLTYVLSSIGGWMLTMKSSTISTLGEDYILVAHARGLSQRRILTTYVGRNAMLPLVTRLAISIGFVVGGSVIIETLYQYPGLGRLLYNSIAVRDYVTMQGVFLVIACSVIFSNILADLMYGVLDPRVRIGGSKS
ncbi:MAG: ABC transporter permease [Anaerolineae bacterium]|nr:ABC transporter permease [Anaerolineae bacterium]